MAEYKTTVGIEVHCELKTKTKMFSGSVNGYGTTANSNINLIDIGYPGTLPQVNEKAVELALRAALLLNCEINRTMHFDRKNYFYPDLPKGYQITQARTPIGIHGYVEIDTATGKKRIGIHDIHIEEDTAKSVHKNGKSYLDFNRAGVPLIEIVTEPDMNSPEEAMAYLERLRELLLYADVSDCKMEEGSMRCDVNVSVSKTEDLGTRTETKNIGSISNVGLAIQAEEMRQIELLEKGEGIHEETRRFDDKKNMTVLMRVKETGNDYRYFPEPDIPYLTLSEEKIENVRTSLPVMPDTRRDVYKKAGVSLINANKLIQNRMMSDYLLEFKGNLVIASNLLLGDIASYLNRTGKDLAETNLSLEKFEKVVEKLDKKEIPNKVFKDILEDLMETEKPIEEIMKEKNIETISDTASLLTIVMQVIDRNEPSVQDYLNGHDRALKYLMGQIMKDTKGQANPSIVNDLLVQELAKRTSEK